VLELCSLCEQVDQLFARVPTRDRWHGQWLRPPVHLGWGGDA
jgi:hypothetical protein